MQHPRHLDVGDVVEGAEDLGRHIETRRRGADDLVDARRLGLGLALGDEIVAELAVPLHRQIEIAVADQLAIAEFARRIAGHGNDAFGDLEPFGRHAEPRRGQLEEHAARLGRGVAQGDAALLHPGAAARTTLVDGPLGVAHHDADALERHVELLGDDLGDRDIDPLAHVHLAEIGDDIAVRLDREPAVELVGGERRLDRGAEFGGGETAGKAAHKSERDDERAGALEEAAAVDGKLGHHPLPYAAWAARRTARRIAICVPQRHLRPESPSRICCSEGCGTSRKSAAAVMIQPLRQ